MSAANLVDKFKGFLGHYAGELRVIASVISTVVGVLPLGRQDKDRVTEIVDRLQDAATNIIESLPRIPDAPTIAVKKSDVEAAVRSILPDLVRQILAEGSENAKNS